MYQLIMIIHVLAAVCIVALVLVQQGKGATVGAAFGSGASQTFFGSRGSGSFLLRVTIFFVVVFFSTSIVLNYLATQAVKQGQVITLPVAPAEQTTGAIPPVSPNSIPASSTDTVPTKQTTTVPPVSPNSIPAGSSDTTSTTGKK